MSNPAVIVYWDDIVVGFAGVAIEMFLYGFHLNMFIVALYTFASRTTAGRRVLLTFTWAMAVLGTTQMVLYLATSAIFLRLIKLGGTSSDVISSLSASQLGARLDSLSLTQNVVFTINNLVSDSLLFYRCYMIWGCRWKIVVAPGFLILSTFIVGCVTTTFLPFTQKSQQAPYILAAVTNLVLVLLTAGRIWWIRRYARRIETGNELTSRYSRAIAMIVESGAIYGAFAILLIVTYPLTTPFAVLQAILRQLINIVPTFIIVRVGLGHHTQPDPPLAIYESRTATLAIHSTLDLSLIRRPSKPTNSQVEYGTNWKDVECGCDAVH
ncbi:hypothetical protein K438DRAFT_1883420 [Mycena galopus ATCC 62051]|nr:hypothetical protein K438DRAFT_1883420 [Mycena galopus ATCC 62051]